MIGGSDEPEGDLSGGGSGAGLRLLSRLGEQDGDAADFAYRRILQRLDEAEERIEIHMYVWRADGVGHLIGEAVLRAAERGVKVRILKDSGAQVFETQESNRKPFFPSERPLGKRVVQRIIGATFPDSYVKDDWDQMLGLAVMGHPNVEFEWVAPTHTKYYCIDERVLITGSLNLEDRHRGYHDVMVEVEGEGRVSEFRAGQRGEGGGSGALRFVLNDPQRGSFAIKEEMLRLIEGAEESVHIEMAYHGDEDVSRALGDAGKRGVKLTVLFSKKSNIGNEVNYDTLRGLMLATPMEVRLSEKMLHTKVMVIDGERAILGSANFSIFSMQKAGELCVRVEGDDGFLGELNLVLAERWAMGEGVDGAGGLPRYSRLLARLQQLGQLKGKHE